MKFNLPNILFKAIRLSAVVILVFMGGCKNSHNRLSANGSPASVPSQDEEGFIQIFDGKTLQGWDGDTTYWRVANGSLTGQVTPLTLLKTNIFIIWRGGTPGDFELKTEFRIATGNSGINYRSEELNDIPDALKGYQADIDGRNKYTGQNFEERGRATLAERGEKVMISLANREVTGSLGSSDSLKALIQSGSWNNCHIIAKGNKLQHFINGVLMTDVIDNDEVSRKQSGLLGLQLHLGPPMKVEYRNIRLKQL